EDRRYYRIRLVGIEFRAVVVGQSGLVSRELDHRELHAEADAEIRNLVLPRVADRGDLAFDTALAEAAGNEDRVHPAKSADAVAFDRLRIDVMDLHLAAGMDAGVDQRFGQRLVRL